MKISIITSCRGFVSPTTIESVKNQTYKDFEWVVVYDGFTDGATFFPSSTFPDNTKTAQLGNNYGPSVARNVGFQISDGDVIAYLDSDDELHPKALANISDAFASTENLQILFGSYYIVEGGKSIFYNQGYNGGHLPMMTFINSQNISIPMGVSHKRKHFVECGGFQRGIVCGEDGILWRRMIARMGKGEIGFTDAVMGTYYVNGSGQSRTQRRFDMGGFAFDGSKNDNGKYLDKDWFLEYNSTKLFDR